MEMASAGRWAWMAEVAGEELAKLEAAHPGHRFAPLKAELQRLVADPGLDDEAALALVSPRAGAVTDAADTTPAASSQHAAAAPSCTVPVCTQESSTQKKRKPCGSARERDDGKRRRRASTPPRSGGAKKDRADMAIERAQRCLERIRAVKQSLLAAWIH